MANFEVISKTGSVITVPDYSRVQVDGLILVGDLVEDWNEPIQQNTMILNKRIYEETIARESASADMKVYVDNASAAVLQSAKEYVDANGVQGGTSGGTTSGSSKLEMYFYGGL